MGINKKEKVFFEQHAQNKMNRVKAYQLRKYEEAKLVEELTAHRKELAQLRVSKVSQIASQTDQDSICQKEHCQSPARPLREAHHSRPRRVQKEAIHACRLASEEKSRVPSPIDPLRGQETDCAWSQEGRDHQGPQVCTCCVSVSQCQCQTLMNCSASHANHTTTCSSEGCRVHRWEHL